MPSATVPNAMGEGPAVRIPCKPFPVTPTAKLPPCASANVTFPLIALGVRGLYCTVRFNDCVALTVTGSVAPLTVTSFAFKLICVIVTSEVPVFVITRFCVSVAPTLTSPKLSDVGAEERLKGAGEAVPVKVITAGETPPSAWAVKVAEDFPVVALLNHTEKLIDCPAGNERGRVAPETENVAVETVKAVIVIGAVPVFNTDTCWGTLLPAVTVPKSTTFGFS